MNSNLPTNCWGHAILHASYLLKFRPSAENDITPYQFANGFKPKVNYLRIFGCAVYVPINENRREKMGAQREKGIYIGCDSPSIIRYLEPTTGNAFRARFEDCRFIENDFPYLTDKRQQNDIDTLYKWPENLPKFTDPKDKIINEEIINTLNLQRLANELPDAFNDAQKVTKERTLLSSGVMNSPEITQLSKTPAYLQPPRKKRGRQIQQTRETNSYFNLFDDQEEPKSIEEAKERSDWPKWKEAIDSETKSLEKRKVFGEVKEVPLDQTLVGFKWVLNRKRNELGQIIRYKARLVAQGFTQKPGIDFDITYSPVLDHLSFRFLISFAIRHGLKIHMLDVITAYLYGKLDFKKFMKIPPNITNQSLTKFKRPGIEVLQSLYGLKQSGKMWYDYFKEYMLSIGFTNDIICPCVFIKKEGNELERPN
jgi:hypothetical protein